jgi:hypothetical protein
MFDPNYKNIDSMLMLLTGKRFLIIVHSNNIF